MNKHPIQQMKLLTTAEVADIVGYTPATVIRWAEMGLYRFPPPAIEGGPGTGKRWHPQDIEHWMKEIRTR